MPRILWLLRPLKDVVKLPTDALSPLTADEIPLALKQEWKWHLFDDVKHLHRVNTSLSGYKILQKLEQEWHSNQMENSSLSTKNINDAFSAIAWEEQRVNEVMDIKRKMEEDEVKCKCCISNKSLHSHSLFLSLSFSFFNALK
jgi:hypothetical protein